MSETATNSSKSSVSQAITVVVVPTYNERENLPVLVAAALSYLPESRILIVDDNSPDGTGEEADRLSLLDPVHVGVLHRSRKEGLGAAYVAGFQYALEQWPDVCFIIQMDADLSHDPRYLPEMLHAAEEADVVVGSRYVHGVSIVNWPLHRLIVSRFGTWFARTFTGLPLTDCTSGFKCYRSDVVRNLRLDTIRSNGYVFQIETSFRAWRLGYRLQDLPIIFYERRAGTSKLSLNIAAEAFMVVLRLGLERLLGRPSRSANQSAPHDPR